MKYLLPLLSFALFAAPGCNQDSQNSSATASAADASTTSAEAAPSHTANLELFVMAKCPYGIQVENALVPVKQKLGDGLNISVNYIGKGSPGSLTSMHGPDEVTGDIAQLCADNQMPKGNFDFIACMDKDPRSIGTNWKDCGIQLGLDLDALTTCVNGDDGQKMLADSFQEADKRGAHGSPTMFLDGKPYTGGRRSNDFMRTICGTYGADAPQACAEIPPPVQVSAIFLSDQRCDKCDIHPLEPKLRGALPGLEVKYVDYSSEEGKALWQKEKAADSSFGMLPTVLLDPAVEKADGYSSLKRYVRTVGDYRELRLGGKFDPTAEICDNGIDDDGNGAIDCKDSGCDGAMECRQAIPKQVDLFVMSHCPYGAKALIATNDTMKHFGGDMNVKVHYIGNDSNGTLSSMHGPTEVDDDIREVCAQKHYPGKFMAYNACISKDYRNADWKACAKDAGISTDTVQSCFDGEGKDLLRASFAESQKLGISSSPTFLANNKRMFHALAAKDVQKQFCTDNPGMAGCSGDVTTDAASSAPVPAGSCGG